MTEFSWQVNPGSISILIITVLISLYGLFLNHHFLDECLLHPYSIFRKSKYYTLITSGFVHANMGHLIFNMITFFFFAFTLERVYIGTTSFVLLYLISMVLSDIPTIIKNRNNPSYYSLGASGAISAVLFCWIVYSPLSKISMMFIPIGIHAFIFGPLYLVYCTVASKQSFGNINHDAHFYGAITGIVFAFILNYQEASQIFYKILNM